MGKIKDWFTLKWNAFWTLDTAQDAIRVSIVVGVVVTILIVGLAKILTSQIGTPNMPCYSVTDSTYICRDYQVQKCLADEKYTKDECIMLVGGK